MFKFVSSLGDEASMYPGQRDINSSLTLNQVNSSAADDYEQNQMMQVPSLECCKISTKATKSWYADNVTLVTYLEAMNRHPLFKDCLTSVGSSLEMICWIAQYIAENFKDS